MAVSRCRGRGQIRRDLRRNSPHGLASRVRPQDDGAMASITRALCALLVLFPVVLSSHAAWPEARASLELDTLFQDHAVLQRGRPIPVTGRANPGESVRVNFAGVDATAIAGRDGRFRVDLPALEASTEGRALRVSTPSGTQEIKDIVVGEVWFCSGQSNMEWSVDASAESERARSSAARLPIRSFKAPHVTANEPRARVDGACRPTRCRRARWAPRA